jgi:hypothetical protein
MKAIVWVFAILALIVHIVSDNKERKSLSMILIILCIGLLVILSYDPMG